MRDLGTYKRCAKPTRARIGQQDLPVTPLDAMYFPTAGRHFTPTAVPARTPDHVYVQLADDAGNPDAARREVFDARD